MPLHLTEQDVSLLLTIPDCIRVVEEAFRRQDAGQILNLPRRRLRPPQGVLHCMEAADLGITRMGLKVYTSFQGEARFLVLLYDSETGELLAVIEADRLGQMRTGAATGVATRYMARPDARRLCLFGSGWQAESQALAIAEVRDLERVAVYSRTPDKRRAFAEAIAPRLRVPVVPAESAEAVMDGADIVVTATSSRIPVFPGSLLRPGMHVNVVGSNSLAKAEIDIDAFRRVDRIVVDSVEQAKWESGDLLGAIETNRVRWEEMAELCEVVAGRRPGRASQDEVTLFKSNGLALEDVAAASLVYDLARERSLGRELSFWALPA